LSTRKGPAAGARAVRKKHKKSAGKRKILWKKKESKKE
jgi:hypothetical protein